MIFAVACCSSKTQKPRQCGCFNSPNEDMVRPDLLNEWDYTKNTLKPSEVAARSGKKAYWKCSVCGNEWTAVIASRSAGAGCPKWRDHKKRKEA